MCVCLSSPLFFQNINSPAACRFHHTSAGQISNSLYTCLMCAYVCPLCSSSEKGIALHLMSCFEEDAVLRIPKYCTYAISISFSKRLSGVWTRKRERGYINLSRFALSFLHHTLLLVRRPKSLIWRRMCVAVPSSSPSQK
jgi:hypothetical protein